MLQGRESPKALRAWEGQTTQRRMHSSMHSLKMGHCSGLEELIGPLELHIIWLYYDALHSIYLQTASVIVPKD